MFEQQAEPKSQQGMWQLSLDYVYRGMVARSVHASKNGVKEMLWNMQRPEKNTDISRYLLLKLMQLLKQWHWGWGGGCIEP